MTPADLVLPRLEGVREAGPGQWTGKCPAHDDRHPSLAIREADGGRLLLHCFGGCDIEAITRALGIDLSDLFERPLAHHLPPVKRPFSAEALLRIIAGEAAILTIIASDLDSGMVLSEIDRARLRTATARLQEALAWVT